MNTTFEKLNVGWNADPNAPYPEIALNGSELLLRFRLNAFQFKQFDEGQIATIHFPDCWRYRLGPTNDEGWYRGQCRFSKLAPQWGEFYRVSGDLRITAAAPHDWQQIAIEPPQSVHFLFYFRDETFECDAMGWSIDLPIRAGTSVT